MNLKKVTDFIVLEDGNIGGRAAMVTGSLLASSVLGTVLTARVAEAWDHCEYCEYHTDAQHPLCDPNYPFHCNGWSHDDYCSHINDTC